MTWSYRVEIVQTIYHWKALFKIYPDMEVSFSNFLCRIFCPLKSEVVVCTATDIFYASRLCFSQTRYYQKDDSKLYLDFRTIFENRLPSHYLVLPKSTVFVLALFCPPVIRTPSFLSLYIFFSITENNIQIQCTFHTSPLLALWGGYYYWF